MIWIAPSEQNTSNGELEKRLWPAAKLSIRRVKKTDDSGRLCRRNLAAHGLENDIRHAIIEDNLMDCIVTLPDQLFYSTQISVCLWFLAKNKHDGNYSLN